MKISVSVLVSILLLCSCHKVEPAGAGVNGTDLDFVNKTSMANTAEISAGQIASTKANDDDVQAFGVFMAAEHSSSRLQLKALADSLQFPAPDSLDTEHKGLAMQLDSLSGRSFDSLYIHSQVKDHQMTIALFEKEISKGRNGGLIDFANNQMPHLQKHLQMADSLAQKF
jgi:putative membrane protein